MQIPTLGIGELGKAKTRLAQNAHTEVFLGLLGDSLWGGCPQNGEGSKKMDIMYSSSWLQGQAQGRKPKDAV